MAKIPKIGIANTSTIQASHITNIIDALDGTGTYDIDATGSFSGSYEGEGSGLTGVISSSYAQSGDGIFSGSFSGSYEGEGSSLTGVISSSYSLTSSYAQSGDGTFSGSFSGSFQGDGTDLTGITAEWDGSHNGNASITGSLTVTSDISSSANVYGNRIDAAAFINTPQIQSPTATLYIASNITASGDISSSAASTASFGTYLGDGSQLTGVEGGIFTETGSVYATTNNLQVTGSLDVTSIVTLNNNLILSGSVEFETGGLGATIEGETVYLRGGFGTSIKALTNTSAVSTTALSESVYSGHIITVDMQNSTNDIVLFIDPPDSWPGYSLGMRPQFSIHMLTNAFGDENPDFYVRRSGTSTFSLLLYPTGSGATGLNGARIITNSGDISARYDFTCIGANQWSTTIHCSDSSLFTVT